VKKTFKAYEDSDSSTRYIVVDNCDGSELINAVYNLDGRIAGNSLTYDMEGNGRRPIPLENAFNFLKHLSYRIDNEENAARELFKEVEEYFANSTTIADTIVNNPGITVCMEVYWVVKYSGIEVQKFDKEADAREHAAKLADEERINGIRAKLKNKFSEKTIREILKAAQ